MTGQPLQHIERIREMVASGMTSSEISANLNLCTSYVYTLAQQAGIKPAREKERLVARIRQLALEGCTRQQIASEVGVVYPYVSRLGKIHGISFVRKPYAGAQREPGIREQQMAALYTSGKTLNEIGHEFGVTRERVRQILTKFYGITAKDGGQHKRADHKRRTFEAKRDARCQKHWGCSYKEYKRILKYPGRPTYAFSSQRMNAQKREIGWELSLWTWWKIWEKSGHWDERGRGYGYVMCRHNDLGPYAVDNVYIATSVENIQDYWADVKSGSRTRRCVKRARLSPEQSKEALRAATRRYRQTPKYRLRLQLRRQGIPKDQRDAIVAEQFGASS